jgi:hypothetical protein
MTQQIVARLLIAATVRGYPLDRLQGPSVKAVALATAAEASQTQGLERLVLLGRLLLTAVQAVLQLMQQFNNGV